MYQDFLHQCNGNTILAENKMLEIFSLRFRLHDKCNSDFGLPEPTEYKSELDIEKLRYDPNQQKQIYEQLYTRNPPTEQQEAYLQQVFHCIKHNIHKIFMLQGEGGSGKTTMAKIIAAFARSEGHLVVGCASTAFAASNYENFYTAHSLFEIPVIEDEEAYDNTQNNHKCNLDKKPQRKQLLDQVKVFIWDEISSQHIRDIKAVFEAMDNFKNSILILQGDYKQIAPVIEYGKKKIL